MRTIFQAITVALLMPSHSAYATATMNLDFGDMTTSDSSPLPAGSLWAIITQNVDGYLPGGLAIDGALSVNTNKNSIFADFAGATIAPNEMVGGGRVLATGSSSTLFPGVFEAVEIDIEELKTVGLNVGDQFGLYWFPDHTTSSNTLPTGANFEIGGFHQTLASVASGGGSGMQIPADGITVSIAYIDSVTSNGDTSFDPILFQAVMVPEPSTALLLMASALILSRRRR